MRRFLPLLALLACSDPQPPAACGDLPQLTVAVDESETIVPCFKDPEGEAFTVKAASQNPEIATAGLTGDNVRVQGVAPGKTKVVITATDPGGLEGTQELAVLVPNRAPTGSMDDTRLPLGIEVTINLANHFSDPDGQALTYTATSSAPSVATVAVSAAELSLATKQTGLADISVTASDGEEDVTVTFEATVVPTVISDDFNSQATLDDWVIDEEDEYTSAKIEGGYMVLTGDTSFFAFATQDFGGTAEDWTVDIALKTTEVNAQAGFAVWTGHERYSLYVFMIGDRDLGGNIGELNWLFAWYDAADSSLYVNTTWSIGTSAEIEDFTEARISLSLTRAGDLSATVNGKSLFNHGSEVFLLNRAVALSVATGPESDAGGASSMNWVALSSEDFVDDTPPGAYVRADVAKLKSRLREWKR